ncbi:hypothetical protein AYK21_01965 [Thermoplasmatales archaeon SG8-52-2]|nr:MAG: hypothetical protein AYK21_01965 [Thermoplasmatales archaeon SG8-52-2]
MQKISKKRIKNRHFLRKAVVFTIISTLLLTAFLPAFNAEFRNVFYKIKDTSYFSRHDPEPIDSEPAISNIDANPDPQKFGGFVNITCNVTDPDGVAEVFLNITDPNNSYQNFSIKANNTGDVYYCNKTYNLAGKYTFFIWAKDTNENSISSSIYTFVVIRWNVVLSVSESNGKNDTAIFGEVDDALDGQDIYDTPKPPSPEHPYIRSWFDEGLNPPYNELWFDYKDYPDTETTWNLSIKTNSAPPLGDTDVNIVWNTDDINLTEYDVVELWNGSTRLLDMKTESNYSYDATYEDVYDFQIKCRMIYVAGAPSGFSATAVSTGQIDLVWSLGVNSDLTYVEWNSISSWSLGEGALLYNDSGTGVSHSGLDAHTTYYYQAWGWNETDKVFSSVFASDDDTTWNTVPVLGVPDPVNGSSGVDLSLVWSVSVSDGDGDSFDWSIECSNGDSNSSSGDSDGIKELDIVGLGYDTGYTVWVNVSDGFGGVVSDWFTFTTRIMPNIIDLKENWNLVSIPINESINKADIVVSHDGTNYSWNDAVTNNIILNFIYYWNAENQNYELKNNLDPGLGYWMYAYEDCNLMVSGNISDGYITNLTEKWNIMGIPFNESLAKQDLIVNYDGTDYTWQEAVDNTIILGFIYNWNRNTQTYSLSDNFVPGYGYWMYAYYNCTLKK